MVLAAICYPIKKEIDSWFEVRTQKRKAKVKLSEPAITLYDPYGRLVKK